MTRPRLALPERPGFRSLVWGIGVWGGVFGVGNPAQAQEGCEFGDQGNDVVVREALPNGYQITYISRPHFVCDGGVQIWADSAVAYSAQGMSHLIGAVRFLEDGRELSSDEARYFSDLGRLQAYGNLRVRDEEEGSTIENGSLVYLRRTAFRDSESMTIVTGDDGVRPRALLLPPPPDSTAVEEVLAEDAPVDSAAVVEVVPEEVSDSLLATDTLPPEPYTVVGDRMLLEGGAAFVTAGDVVIERDSLTAYADSAEYRRETGDLILEGRARVESRSYDLEGLTVTLTGLSGAESRIDARREARLTGDDLLLTAGLIRMYLRESRLERLVAVPLEETTSGDAPDAPTSDVEGQEIERAGVQPAEQASDEPSSAGLELRAFDPNRPRAEVEDFELTADSVEVHAPQERVERVFAAGRARSVSSSRILEHTDMLPGVAQSDWLEGDTVIVYFTEAGESAESDDVEVERIVARVEARSLYRLEPSDSTESAGPSPPAVHYVVGAEITIHMVAGEISDMSVTGQTRGLHLEPLARPASPDSTAAPDTTGLGADPQPSRTPPEPNERDERSLTVDPIATNEAIRWKHP